MTQVQAAPGTRRSTALPSSSFHLCTPKGQKPQTKIYTNNVQLMTDCHSLGNIFQILLTDRNSGLHERLFSGPKVS